MIVLTRRVHRTSRRRCGWCGRSCYVFRRPECYPPDEPRIIEHLQASREFYMEKKRQGHEVDCVDEIRQIMKSNRAELTDIEREVIKHRFALGHKREIKPHCAPLTLEQVGKIIGVTKERVRQIQNKALDKIRQSLEDGFLS